MDSKLPRLFAVSFTSNVRMEGDRRFSLVDHVLSNAELDEERYQVIRLHNVKLHGTKLEVIQFVAKLGLLRNSVVCDCGKAMSLVKYASCSDGFRWSCTRSCTSTRSIRAGSFFEDSRLPLITVIILVSTWCSEAPIADTEWQEEVSRPTIVDWYNFFREVCEDWLLTNPQKIGGLTEDLEAIDVEIDESRYFHRKYHRGRWREGKWVFGGIERESGKCFLVPVEDRSATTLLPIIQEWINPGSRIISDQWAAYNHIADSGDYIHVTVNHSYNFVNPLDREIHTNHVENMWMRAKKKLKRQNGTSPPLFDGYLFEFMWRVRFPLRNRMFNNMIMCIRSTYVV